ncbi:hypothetical protein Curi_c26060 [Gottschalkia acidurici 9a]|uniref:Uncharacterized protein n=1 Tax=Gottschalkia acidurici (strain ATCC 7906 / DSM 604 / BCRC 14475 / CIP 104303 / KCTC 5404 / NCIMB 10678 / 9a) TaxID=1128398 RepID=K0B4V3_GOTA9|nr:hypothetical protein [Gottschalkia acidurici]AFS79601.1 hypothetical protein Curi_c26060 [Gottschalkia acidurici 9a]
MGVKELLKLWTDCSLKLLDNKLIPERIETFDTAIKDLSKFGITDLVIYNISDNDITVRYKEKGSKSFSTVQL